MEELYRDDIMDHYERPRHYGTLDHPDFSHTATNPMCGDMLHIDVQLSPDHNRIADIAFQGKGCIISQSAGSMLMDAVIGKTIVDVMALDQPAMLQLFGAPLTPARRKCALLGLKVLKLGLSGYLTGTPTPAQN
ncbi:MAG: SUF system NifU family Fe-S cluster assembly protein [Herpetosiphon sp.]